MSPAACHQPTSQRPTSQLGGSDYTAVSCDSRPVFGDGHLSAGGCSDQVSRRKHGLDVWTEHRQVRSNSQDLWIGVSCDLLVTSDLVGSFDESAVDERGAGADERDEVWRVDRTPAGLC